MAAVKSKIINIRKFVLRSREVAAVNQRICYADFLNGFVGRTANVEERTKQILECGVQSLMSLSMGAWKTGIPTDRYTVRLCLREEQELHWK